MKKTSFKILCAALAALMILSTFAACKNKNQDETTATTEAPATESQGTTPPEESSRVEGDVTETTPGGNTGTTPEDETGTAPGGNTGTTPGGEDTTPGGEDTTPGGEDTTPGGEDTTPGGDETTDGGNTPLPRIPSTAISLSLLTDLRTVLTPISPTPPRNSLPLKTRI